MEIGRKPATDGQEMATWSISGSSYAAPIHSSRRAASYLICLVDKSWWAASDILLIVCRLVMIPHVSTNVRTLSAELTKPAETRRSWRRMPSGYRHQLFMRSVNIVTYRNFIEMVMCSHTRRGTACFVLESGCSASAVIRITFEFGTMSARMNLFT